MGRDNRRNRNDWPLRMAARGCGSPRYYGVMALPVLGKRYSFAAVALENRPRIGRKIFSQFGLRFVSLFRALQSRALTTGIAIVILAIVAASDYGKRRLGILRLRFGISEDWHGIEKNKPNPRKHGPQPAWPVDGNPIPSAFRRSCSVHPIVRLASSRYRSARWCGFVAGCLRHAIAGSRTVASRARRTAAGQACRYNTLFVTKGKCR